MLPEPAPVPDPAAPAAAYPAPRLYVDGAWIASTAATVRLTDPATGEPLGELPLASDEQVLAAAAAAQRAQAEWAASTPLARFQVISRATALLRERAEAIARVMTLEQGKPLSESRREVLLSADIIEFLAEEGKRAYGRLVPPRTPGVVAQIVSPVPVGPAALFTPWNFPLNLPARKVGAALAAGCTAVLKPSEETPGSAIALAGAFHDAGLPPGVLNLVCGAPARISELLISAPQIRKVSFTGSVPVGKSLGVLCAQRVKRYTAELGGHAPVLVLPQVDVQGVAALSVAAKYRNAGQICTSPTRFFVHESVADGFIDAFAAGAAAQRLGHGLEPGTTMGPLSNARRLAEVGALVRDAVERGARLVCGGAPRPGPGHFYAPTLLADVPASARIMREEPFGPVAIVNRWTRLDDAIGLANGLPYGLAAYLFTQDLGLAHRVAARLEAGMVGVNQFGISQPETPFGGVKESGLGSESGSEGLAAYFDTKLVTIGAG
ncbi:MAG: NAD-dependent succinate-semialdehyde dehydrogenase [Burkholderiaceae bacterium]|nr:NAD-dependent succinate-semialdehyde dehydrogenase [Burkholderiaceae bacterium]